MLCCIPALNFKQRVIVVFIDNSDENMFARPQQIIKPAVVLLLSQDKEFVRNKIHFFIDSSLKLWPHFTSEYQNQFFAMKQN